MQAYWYNRHVTPLRHIFSTPSLIIFLTLFNKLSDIYVPVWLENSSYSKNYLLLNYEVQWKINTVTIIVCIWALYHRYITVNKQLESIYKVVHSLKWSQDLQPCFSHCDVKKGSCDVRCIYLTEVSHNDYNCHTYTIMWENIITVHRFLKTYVSLLGSHLIGENDFFPDFLLLVDITVPMVFPDFNLSLLVDRVDLIFSNSSSEPSRASSSTSSSKS